MTEATSFAASERVCCKNAFFMCFVCVPEQFGDLSEGLRLGNLTQQMKIQASD